MMSSFIKAEIKKLSNMKILFAWYDSFIDSICKANQGDFGVIRKRKSLYNKKGIPEWVKIYDYPSLKNNKNFISSISNLEKFIQKISWDSQTLMLYDRDSVSFKIETSSLRSIKIINYAYSCASLIEQLKPKCIFYHNMPHQFKSWVFCNIAEHMGVKIYYPEYTYIPWRYYLVEGINKPGRLIQIENDKTEEISEQEHLNLEKLFNQRILNSKISMPDYSLKFNGSYSNSLAVELKNFCKRPDLIINKILCIQKYKKLETFEMPKIKDVVFFLHYQPELSTLPRGYEFAQQYNAIKILSYALPKDATLFVREHLGTFKNLCTWKERNREFYNQISSIPNVKILSLERPSYEIINSCGTVATISGTSAIEGLLRKKKIITFSPVGPYMFLNHVNLHKYQNFDKLKNFLIEKKSDTITLSDFSTNLNKFTISGFPADENNQMSLNRVNNAWRDLAREKWINYIINTLK